MSELTDRITDEHRVTMTIDSIPAACKCGWREMNPLRANHARHLIEVTERAVRDQIAADIEAMTVRGPDNRFHHATALRSVAARIARGGPRG